MRFILSSLVVFVLMQVSLFGQEKFKQFLKSELPPGTLTDRPIHALINIGNFSGWSWYNGESGRSPRGFYGTWYPKETGNVIFRDGFLWGGFVQDREEPDSTVLRANGFTFSSGVQPGWIISPGTPTTEPVPVDTENPRVRIYRIRQDWETLTLNDPDLLTEAKRRFGEDGISEENIATIIDQYEKDWQEWPGDLGAPFVDENQNGQWDPGTDTPGIAGADQVIWFACNDLNKELVQKRFNSEPIGLELQVTIWAYNQKYAPTGQGIFKRYRLINKSGLQIDSTFLGIWSDSDIGGYQNDLVGCDTVLQMSYSYNSSPGEPQFGIHGIPPSAVGHTLLQGPVVPAPGNTALFNFRTKPNYRNLRAYFMGYEATAFLFEPFRWWEQPEYTYKWLNGYQLVSHKDEKKNYIIGSGPHAGEPTRFPLSGDPVTGRGDVDGRRNNLPARDVRTLLSTGPFTMLPGDTQEVVFAVVGGNQSGGNHLTSITDLKENARRIRDFYFEQQFSLPGEASWQSEILDQQHTNLKLKVDLGEFQNILTASVQFFALKEEPSFSVELNDNGFDSDDLAGDGIWSGNGDMTNRKYPVNGDLLIVIDGEEVRFPEIFSDISLRSKPRLQNFRVVYENGKQDRRINFNETVDIAFDVINTDEQNSIDELMLNFYGDRVPFQTSTYQLSIPPGGIGSNSSQTFSLKAPSQTDSLHLSIYIYFDNNVAQQQATLPVRKWYPHEIWGETLAVSGDSQKIDRIKPVVIDPSKLTGHTYQIEVLPDTFKWSLHDLTEKKLVSENIRMLHSPKEAGPIVDGIEWKVFSPDSGIDQILQIRDSQGIVYSDPEKENIGISVWRSWSYNRDSVRYRLNAGERFSSKDDLLRIIPQIFNHDFEIRFSDQDSSIYFHWHGNDSSEYVPFTMWDVGPGTYDDSTDDVRLLPGGGVIGEGFDNFEAYTDPWRYLKATDWLYARYPLDSLGSYEAYEEDIMSGELTKNWMNHSSEILGPFIFVTITLPNFNVNNLPQPGNVIRIVSDKNLSPGDLFQVTAPDAKQDSIINPYRYQLYQNYPNPFNHMTHIQFYLVRNIHVRLEVFDILGRRVKTLLNESMESGLQEISWDGTNKADIPVASGLYLYRMKADDQIIVRKLLLVR